MKAINENTSEIILIHDKIKQAQGIRAKCEAAVLNIVNLETNMSSNKKEQQEKCNLPNLQEEMVLTNHLQDLQEKRIELHTSFESTLKKYEDNDKILRKNHQELLKLMSPETNTSGEIIDKVLKASLDNKMTPEFEIKRKIARDPIINRQPHLVKDTQERAITFQINNLSQQMLNSNPSITSSITSPNPQTNTEIVD